MLPSRGAAHEGHSVWFLPEVDARAKASTTEEPDEGKGLLGSRLASCILLQMHETGLEPIGREGRAPGHPSLQFRGKSGRVTLGCLQPVALRRSASNA